MFYCWRELYSMMKDRENGTWAQATVPGAVKGQLPRSEVLWSAYFGCLCGQNCVAVSNAIYYLLHTCIHTPVGIIHMLLLLGVNVGAAGAGASGAAAACEQQLAVVWAEGTPEPLNNTQQLAYTVGRAPIVQRQGTH
jgi:hypothetical protein